MNLYPWVVLLHVAAAFVFIAAHGVSAFVAFRLRGERDPAKVATLLELSSSGLGVMYVSLLTLVLAGIAAGLALNWFAHGWIWAAIGTLVVLMIAMYALASRYYATVRQAVGLPSYGAPKDAPPPAPLPPDQIAVLLDSRRPEQIAGVGIVGLLIILWLMVVKPF